MALPAGQMIERVSGLFSTLVRQSPFCLTARYNIFCSADLLVRVQTPSTSTVQPLSFGQNAGCESMAQLQQVLSKNRGVRTKWVLPDGIKDSKGSY